MMAFAAQQFLEFPPDKNRGQMLPQSFDYEIADTHFIRVGNVLFDVRSFKITPTFTQSSMDLQIQWPAGFLRSGTLQVLDSNRKVLAEKTFLADKIVLVPVQRISGTASENLKTEIASQRFEVSGAEMVRTLQERPGNRICLKTQSGESRAEICSPQFQVRRGEMEYAAPKISETQVSVDGEEVGPQGLIFMQSNKTPLKFEAHLVTGTELRIQIRPRPLDVNILQVIADRKIFRVRGRNLQLADERIIVQKFDRGWVAEVPFERAQFFFFGENGIPLKQEFSFLDQGVEKWPKISYEGEPTSQIYGGSATLELTSDQQVQLKPLSPGAQIRPSGNKFEWTVSNLKKGERRMASLRVETPERSYLAAHEFQRGRRFHLRWGAGTESFAQLRSWLTKKWAIQAGASVSTAWVDVLKRWGMGFAEENPSFILGLVAGSVRTSSQFTTPSTSYSAVGIFLGFPMGDVEGWSSELNLRLASNAYELSLPILYRSSQTWIWELSLGGGSYGGETRALASLGGRFYF